MEEANSSLFERAIPMLRRSEDVQAERLIADAFAATFRSFELLGATIEANERNGTPC